MFSSLHSFSALFLQSLLVSWNYIVTSLESCPGEFSGVSCITFQQYVQASQEIYLYCSSKATTTLASAFTASSAMKYSLSGHITPTKQCVSSSAQVNFQSTQFPFGTLEDAKFIIVCLI